MDKKQNVDIKQLIAQVEKLYSLPTVYYKLDKAINDPTSSNSKIAVIISEDTALTARLLRLANSAFFNFPSRVDTISMAISIIGTRQIRDLTLATSVIKVFEGIPDDVVNMADFWKHSIATGVCARLLGTIHGEKNVETCLVAGLIHDIGSLALYSQLPELSKEIITYTRENRVAISDVEHKKIRADHALLGAMLLKQWKLPHHLVESVQYHHRPSKAPIASGLIDLVHLADIITTGLQIGSSGDNMVPPLDAKALERMPVNVSGLAKVVDLMNVQYQEVLDIVLNEPSPT